MCKYLAGAFRFKRVTQEQSRRGLEELARRAGYHIQLGSEVPSLIRVEISRYVPDQAEIIVFNITSRDGPTWNCIDETLDAELDYLRKKPFDQVPFFVFLRSLFASLRPEASTVIYTEGDETGWIPLERRSTSLDEFLGLLYEFHDRPDREISGVYTIAGAGD